MSRYDCTGGTPHASGDMSADSQLIEILRKEGLISAPQLERVLTLQRTSGASLAGILVREGLIAEDDLFFLLSRHLGVPTIPAERLIHLTLPAELRRRVPRQLAQSCAVLPLDLDPVNRHLSIAMFDPTDTRTIEQLRQVADVDRVSAYLARRSVILETVQANYGKRTEERDEARTPDGGEAERAEPRIDPLEDAETGVELIPGKVSVDASLAREISRLPRSARRHTRAAEAAPDHTAPGSARKPPPRAPGSPAGPSSPTLKMRVPPHLAEEAPTRSQGTRLGDDDAEPTHVQTTPLTAGETASAARAHAQPGRPDSVAREAPLPPLQDALLDDLFAAFGSVISLLERRVRSDATRSGRYGQLSALLARELGMDASAISAIRLAAQLYGLDETLRSEVGSKMRADVAAVFDPRPMAPGGLTGRLRGLGRRLLSLQPLRDPGDNTGVRVIRLIADYVELSERAQGRSDPAQLAEFLGEADDESELVRALVRVVARAEPGNPPLTEGRQVEPVDAKATLPATDRGFQATGGSSQHKEGPEGER